MEDGKRDQVDKSPGNYALSRLNATRHGVLSQHTLLPWEPREEYENLHLSLKQEYAPLGPTEEHLVEEIAGIIWRKRRLRLADTATFKNRFRQLITYKDADIVRSSLIGLRELRYKDDEGMENILTMKSEEVPQELRKARKILKLAQNAQKILNTGGYEKYQLALKTLLPELRENWEEASTVDEDVTDYEPDYEPTPEGLLEFLTDEIIPHFSNRLILLSHREEIMSQAQGDSIDMERLEKLSRYEVFLDRKLERILSMLLKLQALRRGREKVEQ